jgi:hypothetical protein
MITEERLRDLMADPQAPQGISPSAARQRAVAIRRRRRGLTGLTAFATVLLVPAAVVGVRGLARADRAALPYAFAGDGGALSAGPDGWVPLKVPGLFMYDDVGALCLGPSLDPAPELGTSDYGLPGSCLVQGADVGSPGLSVGGGVIAAETVEPVVRADFIEGSTVVHAQVAGLRQFPGWRTLTAAWPLPSTATDNILVRGWDAKGKLILSVGCPGGCPAPVLPSQPAVAPEPQDTSPVPAASSAPVG